jgi:hypothetical protein
MSLTVRKYESKDKALWNQFVATAKNATFLFNRDFMDYHSHRFEDCSLLVFKDEKLLAAFPAHVQEDAIYSHLGLTYGGLIFSDVLGVEATCAIFDEVVQFLKGNSFKSVVVKVLPEPYQTHYSSAFEYALYRQEALLIRRELNYYVDLTIPLEIHKSKLKFKNKGLWDDLEIKKSTDFTTFWKELLIPVLEEQYDSSPVHSEGEINLLAERFPENIIQYTVFSDGEYLAGMTLFISGKVVKSQYGVANENGKARRALDYLYIYLLEKFKKQGYAYFDMGTTNTGDGKSFNKGLSKYKEEFGARPYNQDRYLLHL